MEVVSDRTRKLSRWVKLLLASALALVLHGFGGLRSRAVVLLDLAIHHGQLGSEISEEEEERVGAFTVANLNDTDGDGAIDLRDDVVRATGKRGRDEVDLMRLVLRRPRVDHGGEVRLRVLSGAVTLWSRSTKESRVTALRFPVADLPVELWVEATAPSVAVRDIEIEAEYMGARDKVRATAVWAEMSRFRNGGDFLSVDADGGLIFNTFKAEGGRLGLGDISRGNLKNGVEIEFTVSPPGLGESEPVTFDITRQREWRGWWIRRQEIKEISVYEMLPSVFPATEEEPNDDDAATDEDNEPLNGHIYSVDFPGLDIGSTSADRVVIRFNFNEFVRVLVGGHRFRNSNREVEGSRASAYVPWHSRTDIVRRNREWVRNGVVVDGNGINQGHKALHPL